MTLTPSTMLELGTPAPPFELPDTRDDMRLKRLDDVRGPKGLLVMFICNHCPYVRHIAPALQQLGHDYADSGIGIVAVSANDASQHPQDGPGEMARQPYPFPYLYDESQDVARAYHAACTPDLFLFDGDLKLVYRGQFDDSRPGEDTPVTGRDLRAAMDAVLAGKPVPETQKPSMGCNIKWRAGG